MPQKKNRSSTKRKLKFDKISVLRECCVCMEDLPNIDFPFEGEHVSFEDPQGSPCQFKGACQSICIGCLIKLDWAADSYEDARGNSGPLLVRVLKCPVCRNEAVFDFSMMERVFMYNAHDMSGKVGLTMTKRLFEKTRKMNSKLSELVEQFEDLQNDLQKDVEGLANVLSHERARRIQACLTVLGLKNGPNTPLLVEGLQLYKHAYVMMEIKDFTHCVNKENVPLSRFSVSARLAIMNSIDAIRNRPSVVHGVADFSVFA